MVLPPATHTVASAEEAAEAGKRFHGSIKDNVRRLWKDAVQTLLLSTVKNRPSPPRVERSEDLTTLHYTDESAALTAYK